MRWLALLLFIPLAMAGGVHEGPEPVTAQMFVHHLDAGAFLHPGAPGAAVLAPAPASVACEEPAVWEVPFTRDLADAKADPLVRVAAFSKVSPQLTWFMETVRPGTAEPMPALPLPVNITGELLSGGKVVARGMAASSSDANVEARHVQVATWRLAWSDPATPAFSTEGVVLRITAALDGACAAPVGMRPYGDADHQSRLLWDIYEPVRLDLFETAWEEERLLIRVHASSPWGPLDLADPVAPRLTGPGGTQAPPMLDALDDTGAVAALWGWDASAAANGTYRIDVQTTNRDGQQADAFSTFRIGGDAPPAPVQEAPVKQSPGLAAPALLGLLVLARRISR